MLMRAPVKKLNLALQVSDGSNVDPHIFFKRRLGHINTHLALACMRNLIVFSIDFPSAIMAEPAQGSEIISTNWL